MSNTPTTLISELIQEDPDMRDIVEDFVGDLAIRIEELRTAFQSNDWEAMTRLAHQLKGAGGSYGYPAISQLGGQMESDYKQQDGSNFNEQISLLQALTNAASAGLNG